MEHVIHFFQTFVVEIVAVSVSGGTVHVIHKIRHAHKAKCLLCRRPWRQHKASPAHTHEDKSDV